ncbi:MAG: glutamine synthetase beta-grasp domain-containing protein, partial [Gammaproteobacteria bacterium]|nr:glutamine synthetase beta-grasp domain-containing protein [Gammaproteobacteria bacterium]
MMSASDVLSMISDNEVKFVDFRFTDTKGKEQHITFPAKMVDEDSLENGAMFDGSSISGWKGIQASDMIMRPDCSTAVMDPFSEEKTLIVRCDIIEPDTMQGYERDPRSIANRAEAYLKSTGIADTAFFGPEPEFFVFDGVKWSDAAHDTFLKITSDEGHWQDGADMDGANPGHRPGIKGGYFPVPPVDSHHDLRQTMCMVMEDMGVEVEVHHHEVANAGQCEIGTKFDTLVKRADKTQILKYVVHNVAHAYGKTATFMPKPMAGDNGSG